jgi:hypothetical protein
MDIVRLPGLKSHPNTKWLESVLKGNNIYDIKQAFRGNAHQRESYVTGDFDARYIPGIAVPIP